MLFPVLFFLFRVCVWVVFLFFGQKKNPENKITRIILPALANIGLRNQMPYHSHADVWCRVRIRNSKCITKKFINAWERYPIDIVYCFHLIVFRWLHSFHWLSFAEAFQTMAVCFLYAFPIEIMIKAKGRKKRRFYAKPNEALVHPSFFSIVFFLFFVCW